MNLDQTLDNLESSVYRMGEKVLEQHEKCLSILSTHNKDEALKIVKTDDFINRIEEDINNQAMASFALLSPVASDLRRVIVAIKIASELERIGDYAKGLAGFIIKDRNPEETTISHYAIEMEKEVISMLKEAMEIYQNRDINHAFELPKKDEKIDRLLNDFQNTLLDYNYTEDLTLKQVFYVSGLFRNIERSGDHIINICEHTIFLCKGVQYDFG